MRKILRNANISEIHRAIEDNLYNFWRTCTRVDLKNVKYAENEKLLVFHRNSFFFGKWYRLKVQIFQFFSNFIKKLIDYIIIIQNTLSLLRIRNE